jgi:amino acid transporter
MSQNTAQKINLTNATIIGVNALIGGGIFATPAKLALTVGTAGIFSFIFAFIAVWFMAQAIARVAYLYPQEGSFYVYAKAWGGHWMGILSIGSYIFGLLIALGLLCKISGLYLAGLTGIQEPLYFGIGVLLFVVLFNIAGLKLSLLAQYILLFFTLLPLVAATILGLLQFDSSLLATVTHFELPSVAQGVTTIIFGFFGFECLNSLFGIVENPGKNVPRAIQYTLLIVGALYFLFISAMLFSIPQDWYVQNPNLTPAQALSILYPSITHLELFMSTCILLAIIGVIHSMTWGIGQLIFSFLKLLKNKTVDTLIKQQTITDKTTIIFSGLIMLINLITLDSIDLFFSLTNVFLIFAYTSAMLPLLFLKNEWKSGQNIGTVLGIITALIIFIVAIETVMNELSKI